MFVTAHTQLMPAQAPTTISKEKELELLLALQQGNLDVVKKELHQGDVKLNRLLQDRWTPLMTAAANDHTHVVQYLLDARADVATIDMNGHSALHRAAFFGKLNMVKCLIEHKHTNFKPHKDGTLALGFAHSKQHHMVVDYLISKGATPLPKKLSDITTLFYDEKANAEIDTDAFTLLAHTKLIIAPSNTIKGMTQGGTISFYQPKVLKQNDEDACVHTQLQTIVHKLGGTKEQHKQTNPIIGGTCAYHAIKNGLVGLMLLHDYEQLVTCNDSKTRKQIAQWVNADIKNLTDLKTDHFDAATFLERLHAKIWMMNYKQNFELLSYQGLTPARSQSVKHDIDNTFSNVMKKRYMSTQRSYGKKLSFVDEIAHHNIAALSALIGGIGLEDLYKNNSHEMYIAKIEASELWQQIAIFRTQDKYRHAFSLRLSSESYDGYGVNDHAIAVVIEKRGSTVNVILGESNNAPHIAIKDIVFDFIDLFTDNQKYPMSTTQLKTSMHYAVNLLGCSITTPEKGLPSFESLVQEYARVKNNCAIDNRATDLSTKKRDAHSAFILLSEIKHIYGTVLQKKDTKEWEAVQAVLTQYGIQESMRHEYAKNSTEPKPLKEEIALHTLITQIADEELNQCTPPVKLDSPLPDKEPIPPHIPQSLRRAHGRDGHACCVIC